MGISVRARKPKTKTKTKKKLPVGFKHGRGVKKGLKNK